MKLDKDVVARLQDFKGISKLKKAALNIMVKQLNPSDLTHLNEQFHKIDTDQTGLISYEELS